MAADCIDCGHRYAAHVAGPCVDCEDEVFFEDRAQLLLCQGYVPSDDPEDDPAYWFAVNQKVDQMREARWDARDR